MPERGNAPGERTTFQCAPIRSENLLGVTDEIRSEAKAWNIGTFGGSPEQRAKARKERQRRRDQDRRNNAGCKSRKEYERNSINHAKPWEGEGISRATWYRRGKRGDRLAGTSPITPNKVRQVRVRQVQVHPIKDRETGPIAANIIDTQTDAAASGLASIKTASQRARPYRRPKLLSGRNRSAFPDQPQRSSCPPRWIGTEASSEVRAGFAF